ncbi:hypothetical protein Taro_026333 [Colocasia esculenta]|uniref:C2H2-type domain-containing protein n=1 Tax=Colocasia esculenta TaxID=4460 RepID=A0A843VB67_COLES|nr:hypothetical protein [Colocasia esculenta]
MKRFREAEGCEMESINMANVLLLFSSGAGDDLHAGAAPEHPAAGRVFECKTCSRRFPSFQALGGHRASHKKPRLAGGDPAAALGLQQSPPAPAKPRVHECSICGLEFAIGQALGGHMRRHRAAGAEAGVPHELAEKKAPVVAGAAVGAGEKRPGVVCLGLDLNLPPSENDKDFLSLGFGRGLHMVDCFH